MFPIYPKLYDSVTFFPNSQAALNALKYPTLYSGQFLIKNITLKFHRLKSQEIVCSLQWSPAHSKIPGNMQTHILSQLAMYIAKRCSSFYKPYFTLLCCKTKRAYTDTCIRPKTSFHENKSMKIH